MKENYYDILGVAKDAGEAEIKKAYRKKAMSCHPDRHQGDKKKEAEFKKLGEAYAVLSDQKKRAQYDQFGTADFGAGGNPFGRGNPFWWGWSAQGFDFSDLFGGGFKQGSSQSGNTGGFEFDFGDLFGGWNKKQRYQESEPEKKEEENLDVIKTVEIPFMDFLFDTSVRVQTVYNKNLTLKVKAGTRPGTKFKVKWKWRSNNGKTGDMYVIVNAKMPEKIPENVQKMAEAIRYEL